MVKGPVVKSKPSAYVITIDGAVLKEAGKNGLIKNREVADRLRSLLEMSRPESNVLLFGWFELTGAS